jgi:tRNA-dihydrouridine synthase B
MIDHYGEDVGIRMARKHIGWYSSGLRDSSDFRSKINQLSSATAVKDTINDFYNKLM